MSERPVFVFGAGATRACGGPKTDELLPTLFPVLKQMLGDSSDGDAGETSLLELVAFLREIFHLDIGSDLEVAPDAVFPSLPLVLSILDLAVDNDHPIGRWETEELRRLQRAFRLAVMAAIDIPLLERRKEETPYERLLAPLYEEGSTIPPVAITLNYDGLLDKAMIHLAEESARPLPDYGCDIVVPIDDDRRYGRLLKLHGSLNWLFCRSCARLSLHISGLRKTDGFWEAVGDLFEDMAVLLAAAGEEETDCPRCKGPVGPLLITPSRQKDYRNPHVSRIWYEAEVALRRADRVVLIGYSLPWDDVQVIYTLRRSLEHLQPGRITVVQWSPEPTRIDQHPAGRRYRSLFGPSIEWVSAGFEGWLDSCEERKISPVHGE